MPLALIPVALLLLPILEIATFIVVGKAIGVLPTLGLVVLSVVVGIALLRRQGLSTLSRIQTEIAAGGVPERQLVHGVMIVLAGILLILPGLLTDVVGYLLFVPAVREGLWRLLSRRVTTTVRTRAAKADRAGQWQAPGRRAAPAGPEILDLPEDEFERRPDPTSPWNGDTPNRPTSLR